MKPNALLRSLRRLATSRGWTIEIKEGGNHTKVTMNGRRTVIGRHPAELKPGTFRAILKQLGVTAEELED